MRGTHLGPTCTQTSPLPVCTEATLPNSTGTATHLQPTIFNNIPQERAVRGKHLVFLALNLHLYQSAPRPRYQTLRGPHTYYLHFLILCAQERVMCGTHLGLSCTQPTPPPVCTEAMPPNLSFLVISLKNEQCAGRN